MTKDIGWSVRTGFFEPLRVHIVNEHTSRVSQRELRVPCCQPVGEEGDEGSRDPARLERLLRAHEQAVARQRITPDALELVETFSPLLAELRKSEGRRARVVELSTRTPWRLRRRASSRQRSLRQRRRRRWRGAAARRGRCQ